MTSGGFESAHQILSGGNSSSASSRGLPRWEQQQQQLPHARRTVIAPCAPLQRIMAEAGLADAADFLSLDVEGAEALVLRTVHPASFRFLMVPHASRAALRLSLHSVTSL